MTPVSLTTLILVGINLGGLVKRVPLSAELSAERDQLYDLLNQMRLCHDAAELDLEDFISEEEGLRNSKYELQRSLVEHAKRMEDAYEQGNLNNAVGLEQAHKNMRVSLAVRLRDLSQKAFKLVETIEATQKRLSEVEVDTIRAKQRLHVIESRLLPVNNLTDALNV